MVDGCLQGEQICSPFLLVRPGVESRQQQQPGDSMKIKAVSMLVAAVTMLQGCGTPAGWAAVWLVPDDVITRAMDGLSGGVGEHCVPSNVKVGDRVRTPNGGAGVVKELAINSMACSDPTNPQRVLIEPAPGQAVASANRFGGMQSECVPASTAAGDTVNLDGRPASVKLVYGESYLCKDAARPVRASVIFN